jgi:nitrate/TMAO reductase-like tetraheme cytochrome c subunit
MTREQTDMDEAKDPAVPTAGADATPGARKPGGRARVILIVVLVFVGLVLLFDVVTASPRLCGSCHEMQPRTESWQQSSHVSVDCVQCHQTPRPWYAYPVTLADRAKLLARDVSAHVSGDFDDPVDGPIEGVPPMADEVCLQCHDANRKATSGFRIKIDHVEHAKRNGSCVSCHVRTAHPVESLGTPLTLMSQCFTCHGTEEQPEASAACFLCHPRDYELIPESHTDNAWTPTQHADAAVTDRKQCDMCHQPQFCDSCHGLEMPHPDDWAKGAEGHAVVAEQDRAVCTTCHTEKPDLCSMCHHKDSFDPTKGTWIQQHFIEVERQGSDYCMECHLATYCVRCHVSWATSGETTE